MTSQCIQRSQSETNHEVYLNCKRLWSIYIKTQSHHTQLCHIYFSLFRGCKRVTGLNFSLHLWIILIKRYKSHGFSKYILTKIMKTQNFVINIIFDVMYPLKHWQAYYVRNDTSAAERLLCLQICWPRMKCTISERDKIKKYKIEDNVFLQTRHTILNLVTLMFLKKQKNCYEGHMSSR